MNEKLLSISISEYQALTGFQKPQLEEREPTMYISSSRIKVDSSTNAKRNSDMVASQQ
jgi:hypothetical protein